MNDQQKHLSIAFHTFLSLDLVVKDLQKEGIKIGKVNEIIIDGIKYRREEISNFFPIELE